MPRPRRGMFVLHADALHGRPHDGHTLGKVLSQTQSLTGVAPTHAYVDKGYKGHKQNRWTFDPHTHQSTRPPWRVFMSGRKALKPHLQRELKRPLRRRARHRSYETRAPDGAQFPQRKGRRSLQRQSCSRRLQLQTPHQVVRGFYCAKSSAQYSTHLNHQHQKISLVNRRPDTD